MNIKINQLFLVSGLLVGRKNTIENLSDRKKNVKERERAPFSQQLTGSRNGNEFLFKREDNSVFCEMRPSTAACYTRHPQPKLLTSSPCHTIYNYCTYLLKWRYIHIINFYYYYYIIMTYKLSVSYIKFILYCIG